VNCILSLENEILFIIYHFSGEKLIKTLDILLFGKKSSIAFLIITFFSSKILPNTSNFM